MIWCDRVCTGGTVGSNSLSHSSQTIFDPPVFGDLQLCDVGLNECHVAVVTIVLSVFLHKALHEIHSRHVFGFGQQVAGVATAETRARLSLSLDSKKKKTTKKNNKTNKRKQKTTWP